MALQDIGIVHYFQFPVCCLNACSVLLVLISRLYTLLLLLQMEKVMRSKLMALQAQVDELNVKQMELLGQKQAMQVIARKYGWAHALDSVRSSSVCWRQGAIAASPAATATALLEALVFPAVGHMYQVKRATASGTWAIWRFHLYILSAWQYP